MNKDRGRTGAEVLGLMAMYEAVHELSGRGHWPRSTWSRLGRKICWLAATRLPDLNS